MLIKQSFHGADLRETTAALNNPERGFYRIFSFAIGEEWRTSSLEDNLRESDPLVMVLMNIGNYRMGALDDSTLDEMEEILQFFVEKGKDIIFRVAYDSDGHGMEKEPYQFSIVRTHMEQVSALTAKFGRHIFVYQGLLLGNWGEMHSSKYLKKQYLLELADICRRNLNGNTYMAVRCPYQYRIIFRPFTDVKRETACDMGFFDDAILASDTDMGTFAYPMSGETAWEQPWARPKELEFENKLCRFVPNGGEAVYGDGYSEKISTAELLNDFGKMHLTYLNRLYDTKILDNWKKTSYAGKGVWNRKSLYEYIDAHLGYRFHVQTASAMILPAKPTRKRAFFTIEIANKGFANLYRKAVVRLIAVGEDGKELVLRTHLQLNEVNSGTTCKYQVGMNFPLKNMKYKFYLEAYRTWDHAPIYFANKAEGSRVYLGTLQI